MKKNKCSKKIKILMLFICIFSLSNIFNAIYAEDTLTKEKVGETIASFAINFANNYASECAYPSRNCSNGEFYVNRSVSYFGKKTNQGKNSAGQTVHNKYMMDCVGWVNMAVHWSTGLELSNPNGGDSYVSPTGPKKHFESVSGPMKPGDIIVKKQDGGDDGHVMIYVGKNQMVDMKPPLAQRQLMYVPPARYMLCRITDEAVKQIKAPYPTDIFQNQGSNLDEGFGFEDNGMAHGAFGAEEFKIDWILNSLKDILGWILGTATYFIRMILLGWTAIFENLANMIIEKTSGVETNITIEKIVTNKVPILDINMFNFAQAGGQTLEQDSAMYIIRLNIAKAYYFIYSITIAGLLITLLYIGIRLIISSIAEEKAKYKEMLLNWVVSIFIVNFITIFMITVIKINEQLIEIISKGMGSAEFALYDSVRAASYEINAFVGWPAFIIYLVLVYLMIKFLWIYFRRFFEISVLTFIAPVIGIGYAIDKIKDNKSQSLSGWMKEYIFTVIIQSVHCLLYYLFISLAFKIAITSFGGAVMAAFLLNFILKAEKIIKKIFGIKSSSVKDALATSIGVVAGAALVGKVAKSNFKMLGKVTSPITKEVKTISAKRYSIKKEKMIQDLEKAIKYYDNRVPLMIKSGRLNEIDISELLPKDENGNIKLEEKGRRRLAEIIVEENEKAKKQSREIKLGQAKKFMKLTGYEIRSKAGLVAAIPATIINPAIGGAMLYQAKADWKKGINFKGKDEDDEEKTKGQKFGEAMGNVLTGNLIGTSKNLLSYKENEIKNIGENVSNEKEKQIDTIIQKQKNKLNSRIQRKKIELEKKYRPSQVKKSINELFKRMDGEEMKKPLIQMQIDFNINKQLQQESGGVEEKTLGDVKKAIMVNPSNAKLIIDDYNKRSQSYKIDAESFEEVFKIQKANNGGSITEENVRDALKGATYLTKKAEENILNTEIELTEENLENVIKSIRNVKNAKDINKDELIKSFFEEASREQKIAEAYTEDGTEATFGENIDPNTGRNIEGTKKMSLNDIIKTIERASANEASMKRNITIDRNDEIWKDLEEDIRNLSYIETL